MNNLIVAEKQLVLLKSFKEELIELEDAYKANQVAIQIETIEAWLKLENNEVEEALSLMRNAVEMESMTSKHPVTPGEILPADELLADMLLKVNKPLEALDAYELNPLRRPNRFNGIYGAALAAKESGNNEKAIFYFESLLELTIDSNSDRPEIREAKEFLQQNMTL